MDPCEPVKRWHWSVQWLRCLLWQCPFDSDRSGSHCALGCGRRFDL